MIDIEVFSHTFTEFYHNCFNKDINNSKYTPYFSNTKNNNYSSNPNYLISHNKSRNNIISEHYSTYRLIPESLKKKLL